METATPVLVIAAEIVLFITAVALSPWRFPDRDAPDYLPHSVATQLDAGMHPKLFCGNYPGSP